MRSSESRRELMEIWTSRATPRRPRLRVLLEREGIGEVRRISKDWISYWVRTANMNSDVHSLPDREESNVYGTAIFAGGSNRDRVDRC